MNILLTNDDSHCSPLFQFAIEKLRTLGNLTIVVPKEEQSWTGKSITRFSDIHVEQIEIQNYPAFSVDGTPADCVNLAIYHLVDRKPDLVVSGINIGENTGLGFVLSSGTVGACLEANIARIPAIALSQSLDRPAFLYWVDNRAFRNETVDRLRVQTHQLLDRIFDVIIGSSGDLSQPITWNVNLPIQAAVNYQVVNTILGHTYYGSCFKRTGDRYHHDLDGGDLDQRAKADRVVLQNGDVSITRIDLRTLGQLV